MDKFGLYENSTKPEAYIIAEKSARYLVAKGAECCASPELLATFPDDLSGRIKSLSFADFHKFADIVISFGGDGTMLSASKIFIDKDMPIMGINVGRLGFLAEFPSEKLEESLDKLISGEYRVVNRTFFETVINGVPHYALNDIVIEKVGSRMLNVYAYAGNHLVAVYRADGLIVSTPTGSTAYSLSCGGPVIHPGTEVVCLTPISPHSLTLRPLILPDNIEIIIRGESAAGYSNLSIDGQVNYQLSDGETVKINKSTQNMKMIKPLNTSYYDLLSQKLLWAANSIDCKAEKIDFNKE